MVYSEPLVVLAILGSLSCECTSVLISHTGFPQVLLIFSASGAYLWVCTVVFHRPEIPAQH